MEIMNGSRASVIRLDIKEMVRKQANAYLTAIKLVDQGMTDSPEKNCVMRYLIDELNVHTEMLTK